ncbi:MAG: hypothetical protein NTV34_03265, partial [Proteobacteria bacterium]|nr:hypothetical protein [Pseudomonadota bacterium]
SSERTPHNLETRAFHLSVDTGKSIAFDVADFRAKSAVTKIFETPKFFNAKLAHQIEIAQLQTNDPLGEIDLDKLQNGAHMEAICAMKP